MTDFDRVRRMQQGLASLAGIDLTDHAAEPVPPLPDRRLRACVEAWPEAQTGAYDPHCCRFPKSCSATVYDPGTVADADLEPAAEPVPSSPAAPLFRTHVVDGMPHDQIMFVSPRLDEQCRRRECDHRHEAVVHVTPTPAAEPLAQGGIVTPDVQPPNLTLPALFGFDVRDRAEARNLAAAYEHGKAEQAAEVERLTLLLEQAEQYARDLQDGSVPGLAEQYERVSPDDIATLRRVLEFLPWDDDEALAALARIERAGGGQDGQ